VSQPAQLPTPADELRQAFGRRLRQYRKGRDWTQVRLGVRLGISERTVANWEAGVTPIPLESAELIAQALVIPSDWYRRDLLPEQGPYLNGHARGPKVHSLQALPGGSVSGSRTSGRKGALRRVS
jgi:transcriptional regulator with XRE-family HTH domain